MEKKITFLSLFLLSAIAFAVVTTQDASAQQINSNKEGCATCPPAKLIPNGQYALVEQTGSVYRFAITDIQESFYYKMIDALNNISKHILIFFKMKKSTLFLFLFCSVCAANAQSTAKNSDAGQKNALVNTATINYDDKLLTTEEQSAKKLFEILYKTKMANSELANYFILNGTNYNNWKKVKETYGGVNGIDMTLIDQFLAKCEMQKLNNIKIKNNLK